MPALIIDARVLVEVERIRTMALAKPVDMQRLMSVIKLPRGKAVHMKQMVKQTIDIPIGYVATFSMEIHAPRGLARHLSVSVDRPGKLPSMEAVWMIAEAFGFTGALTDCTIWLEELQRDDIRQNVPNLVQFVMPAAVGHT